MRAFLTNQYPSKAFMAALGVKKTTLHQWADRGYIHLGEPGTGRSVILTGEEILYAAAINMVSKAGGTPKEQLKGLRSCVAVYAAEWRKCLPSKGPGAHFAVFRCVDYGHSVESEWELFASRTGEGLHIVEGHGDKPLPIWMVIDLEQLLHELTAKIDGRRA